MIFSFLQISRTFHEIQWFFHDLETDLNFNEFSRAVGTLINSLLLRQNDYHFEDDNCEFIFLCEIGVFWFKFQGKLSQSI